MKNKSFKYEYKIGDKVIVIDGEKSYITELFNKYNLVGIGIVFDGIRLYDEEVITFKEGDIYKRILKEEEIIGGISVVEEKKYLKTWEAIKALEEGESIRREGWTNESYRLYKTKNNDIFEKDKFGLDEVFGECFDNVDLKANDWEIYKESKKEIPKEFEGLKYILGSINNMDCGDKDCDKCPLGMDKCNMLDEIFFDIKEKYNF